MMKPYLLNKDVQETINAVHQQIFNSFVKAMETEYFQGQTIVASSEKIENLAQVVISVVSKFSASQIKKMSSIQGVDKAKVKQMYFTCVEKFLDQGMV